MCGCNQGYRCLGFKRLKVISPDEGFKKKPFSPYFTKMRSRSHQSLNPAIHCTFVAMYILPASLQRCPRPECEAAVCDMERKVGASGICRHKTKIASRLNHRTGNYRFSKVLKTSPLANLLGHMILDVHPGAPNAIQLRKHPHN